MKKLTKAHVSVTVEAYRPPKKSSCSCAGGCYTGSPVLASAVKSRMKI